MKYILSLLLLIATNSLHAQQTYWQQQVNFKLDVTLNDADHSLDGFAKIEYINNSPDTLRFIWFHLWPNAYRTDRTAFSDQLLENGRTDFYFSNSEDRGYINRLDFRVNSVLAKTEDHPQHIDIIKVLLPQPLAPGASIELTTPFHVKLPKNFSRGGHIGKTYQVTQWYPKPAVYDRYGWHPMPYLDQGEFYSEFGNYEVKITLPKSYVVLSTGNLQNSEELQWLKDKARIDEPKQVIKTKKPAPTTKKTTKPLPVIANKEETKTLFYTQNNVHDFAWFADKKYLVRYDTIQLNNNRVVDVFTAFSAESKSVWKNSTHMVKDAVRFRSNVIGEYPYNTIAAVEAKMGFEGGMEYPCITAITPMSTEKNLESVLEHEVGHNWFQGMIANNEQVYPWFDEGINSYYDKWFEKELSRYKPTAKKKKPLLLNANDAVFLETFERLHLAQPLSTTADSLTEANYSLIAYEKGAQFMQMLENELGRDVFLKGMQQYFEEWKHKHPYPSDLKASLEKSSGKNLDSAFALLHQENSLQPPAKKKLRIAPFAANNSNTTNALIITPVAGINMYDGFMIGAALTNYTLPPTKFQFIVAPMYGTRSKQLNGVARASYTMYPSKTFQRITLAVNALKFSTNDFVDTANQKYITGFRKIAPSLKFVFAEKNPRSTRERFIQWKTFLLDEDDLRFRSDTFPNGDRFTKITTTSASRYLNQLRFVIQDNRVLYPYRGELMAEQARDFVRLAFTGNYYFNYNEKLGADIRVFAGKFIYLGERTISKRFGTDPYHLNLSAPKGYEDYTYSNYFVGRNEFEGFASQQMMMRDGGFKVRTDLLANKIGKTDDWLMALNFSTDIPDQINILNILPFKVPLKVYMDIGTYADAWKANAEGSKVLYNAGLQLSLFKNTINIYAPLFYSKPYKDYFLSTITEKRFLKNISFTIDIQNFSLKKIDRRMPF
ncbi:M1 family metallopeptidase [Lacibacter sp.]|uniref:M1 family metallopeptidase n=1 Tax=Lacibacter sp. TaxID=1915409 RepID=UPI002B4B7305|nr:M1 family metallopeptidase [Lacibacter sp.]HLP36301.1 M1 family metallopeptidase [Lacibacter sp.]